jgi:hypothetical protein
MELLPTQKKIKVSKKFDEHGRVLDQGLAYKAARSEVEVRDNLDKGRNEVFGPDQDNSLRTGELISYNKADIERIYGAEIAKKIISYLGDLAATESIKNGLLYESWMANEGDAKGRSGKRLQRVFKGRAKEAKRIKKEVDQRVGKVEMPEEVDKRDFIVADPLNRRFQSKVHINYQ